ncbi:paraquat-inducible protein A [Solimonas soli]|uniref:paraquat-inducible protein A n=1 Tax=Solimonas soli TaxID=413479 RepID=UPI0004895DD2|nr:paraquat-inducible protein A [Solimonas soli]
MRASSLVVCEHCDAVHERRRLAPRERALCVRCGAELYRAGGVDLYTMLALTLASLIVFVIANVYPIITLELQGVANRSTLWGAIHATWETGVGPVAVLAALTVFFFPLAQILMFGYVLFELLRGRAPRGFVDIMHALRLMRPWSMVEVFMLGTLVSVVKIAGLAQVTPEIGIFAFGVLTILLTTINSFDLRLLWDAHERVAADGAAAGLVA